jgi:hypothetical protein
MSGARSDIRLMVILKYFLCLLSTWLLPLDLEEPQAFHLLHPLLEVLLNVLG